MIRRSSLLAIAVLVLVNGVAVPASAELAPHSSPLLLNSPALNPAVAAQPSAPYKKYCIAYKKHPRRKTCCGSCATQHVMIEVKDPCCCPVLVPICVPSCCQDAPVVCTGRDVLGRYSYTYQWSSGYKVDIVFRRRGDIVVHTWGR